MFLHNSCNIFSCFYRTQPLDKLEGQQIPPLPFKKVTLMAVTALACIAATAFSLIKQRPWIAAAITIGGISLEIALMVLMPNRSAISILEDDILEDLSEDLKDQTFESYGIRFAAAVKDLEKCYPIKAIDPVTLRDRQEGGMKGQAFGDAIGLYTEFTTRDEAQEMINGMPLDMGSTYPEKFIRGYNWSHIKRFIKNGWTDDTDQALSLLRALYRTMNIKKRCKSRRPLFCNSFC